MFQHAIIHWNSSFILGKNTSTVGDKKKTTWTILRLYDTFSNDLFTATPQQYIVNPMNAIFIANAIQKYSMFDTLSFKDRYNRVTKVDVWNINANINNRVEFSLKNCNVFESGAFS